MFEGDFLLISLIRTLILYILVITALRIMGKRQIGEMQPSELVVAIMISDLASVPMAEQGIPLLYGIIPIFTMVIAEMTLAFGVLKSEKLRSILSGRPSVIMLHGVIDESEMRKIRFNLSDFTEELRLQGYLDISVVDTAILETNGQMTIIPKSKYKTPDCSDIGIDIKQDELPYILISDGKLNSFNLERSGFDFAWVVKQIKKQGAKDVKDVFCMTYYNNECFVQLKNKREKKM